MGLGGEFVRRLTDLTQRGALENFSTVIEIGAQQLSNSLLEDDAALDELYSASGRQRVSLGSPIDAGSVGGNQNLAYAAPSSREFWQSLGFHYTCLDFDGHRDSVALDLNKDDVPGRFRGAFDLLVNTGTTEHVANQDNAFRVMHDLCRPGGIMIHEVPAGGLLNHGMFNYNMKFFWHLCRYNNYKPLYLRLASYLSSPVPQNIIDSNTQFSGEGEFVDSNCTVPDLMITAVLQKPSAAPYVTPLDIPPDLIEKPTRPVLFKRMLRSASALRQRLS